MTDTELTRQLAALMGWEETKQIGDLTVTDDIRYFLHPTDGILIGTAQFATEIDGERWYYRSWLPWRPLIDMNDAWMIVTKLRDAWTAATDGVSGFDPDFPRPFDDTYFFDLLRRNADRRWPWAFLYVTPRAICLAALKTRKKP